MPEQLAGKKHAQTAPGNRALPDSAETRFLQGSGEMAGRIRRFDWSRTPLGPIESWPHSLRTAVSLCLASNFPINIIWGPEHTQVYNDGYRDVCGDVHPRALGEDYSVTWASAWPAIGESFARALAGETMYLENQRMFLKRLNGELEETFFTFSHSPIHDENGAVGGLFHPVTETSGTMLAERRTRALRDLSASLLEAGNEAEVARRTVEVLSRFEFDLPFLLHYALDAKTASYSLAAHHGVAPGKAATPLYAQFDAAKPWPFGEALAGLRIVEIGNVAALFQGEACGPYEEPPNSAFVLPIVVPSAERPPAVIVAGASSRLPMSEGYRSFYELLSVTISGAMATVRAREDERRRAEALAEIDRAKTVFFTNISHELRTPLTLMLGPLDDALARNGLPAATREQLQVAHRNSVRLLKLVNTLLDFSRIEAGRIQASYEPTDLAAFTSELASVFRSAMEKAGLRLVVECPPLPEPVYVDREMWEKIVLNLLSNAFKFTSQGKIRVALRRRDDRVELSVSDTGCGIPEDELPKIFQRFYRVRSARSRTYEGTGIGLSLVQELASLHGGEISVQSREGEGSVFTVTVQTGTIHLPAERIGAPRDEQASTSLGPAPFLEEASQWLPGAPSVTEQTVGEVMGARALQSKERATDSQQMAGEETRPRVLFADDNADMREYVRRLLAPYYRVSAVADGQAALESIRLDPPDLVLADVMMPRMDGFELLNRVRSDARTRALLFVMLSARAGEEARVVGLNAGADDYLVKPFSARELLARIRSQLEMGRLRRETDERVLAANTQLSRRLADLEKANLEIKASRRASLNLTEDLRAEVEERKQTEEKLRESGERFRAMADNIPQLAWMADAKRRVIWFNRGWLDYTGTTLEENVGAGWKAVHHPDYVDRVAEKFERHLREGKEWEDSFPLRGRDGRFRWFLSRMKVIRDESGKVERFFGTNTDITEQRNAEDRLRKAEKMAAAGQLAASMAHEINNPLSSVTNALYLLDHHADLDTSARGLVTTAATELARVSRIVKQSLSYHRIGANPVNIDLGQLVEESLELFSNQLDKAGIQLRKRIETGKYVLGFSGEIRQVLDNLLLNAMEAMSQGGRLSVSVRESFNWKHRGQRGLRLTIADSGRGIARENLSRIFEPFFTTKAEKGTGLGLWVLQGIVFKHEGTITVRSSDTKGRSGTVISIFLSSHHEERGKTWITPSESVAGPRG